MIQEGDVVYRKDYGTMLDIKGSIGKSIEKCNTERASHGLLGETAVDDLVLKF